MFKEFKEFIMRGNIMDMAVGVIIGGAFQKIVTSLVEDVIMPLITMATGKVDFSDLVLNVGSTSIKYGSFISTIIDFLIIALSIFVAVKAFNKLNARTKENIGKVVSKKLKRGKKEEATQEVIEPETKLCPYCYSEINYKATKCPHCTSDISEKV